MIITIRRRCRILAILILATAFAFCSMLLAFLLVAESPTTTISPVQRLLSQGFLQQGRRIRSKGNNKRVNRTDCFSFNSLDWLGKQRLGNANDTMMDDSLGRRMILSSISLSRARSLLSGTICDSKSPLVSMQPLQDAERRLRYWKTRLTFLAVHAHQHQPALPELEARRQSSCRQTDLQRHNIGPFDFECPTAKFLVVRLFGNGIGANMRLGAAPAYMAGLSTNRVVVFVNNASVGPDFLQNQWSLASCFRGDMQCFYMPSSPCVLTNNELSNAPVLRKHEVRRIFRNGTLSPERQQERVVIMRLNFRPQREPDNLKRAVHQLALPIAQRLAQDASDDEQRYILQAAQDLLHPDTVPMGTYNYYGANSPLFHGLLLYAMRPNTRAAKLLQLAVQRSLPKDYAVENAVGLAIRASDKCDDESECLSFSQYVRSVGHWWTKHDMNTTATSIFVTTESRKVIDDLRKFVASEDSRATLPFPANFVVNKYDVLQDTGFLHNQQPANYTQDDVMLSAVSSLQLQLATRLTVGNCCSNFHLLLSDFLSEGCGLAVDNQFHCLQDHPDPEFRLCCQWDKSAECLLRKNSTVAIAR
ncbi:hypothetical protein MPSEU_000927600 [Mayamaea pseudoterrestris]|nr:hypothetical protein MPSEU_000927600 [Mayamaea pseudoterrestris]